MLSIIIPTVNAGGILRDCLEAVRGATQDYELIVVDNGATPPVAKPHMGFVDVTLIRNETNRGFPVAVNQGILASKGDTVVLLNDDVIVTSGWAGRLAAALEEYDIVGPMTNYCTGRQRVQIAPYDSQADLNKSAEDWAQAWGGHTQEVRWVIGFCMAFRKSLYDAVGPFDESLWPCCGEEIDFCFRAAEHGFRTGIATGCYVHHEGSVTFKDISAEHPYNDIVDRNNKHLADRWGDDWSKQDVGIGVKPVGCSLNLGCGLKHLDGFVNIDNRSETEPDLVCDVTCGLPYEDNSVDLVRADDFLEHIPIGKVIPLMNEIWRVLKPDGIFESMTPSTDGRGAFQDPTHVSFWNRNSWEYYSKKPVRELYGIVADFDIENIEDIDTDRNNMVIHTHVIARARK
jgi:GT2 family glycosyltransferase